MSRDMPHSTCDTYQVQVMMGLQQQVQMKCAACSGTGVEGAKVQLSEPYTLPYAPNSNLNPTIYPNFNSKLTTLLCAFISTLNQSHYMPPLQPLALESTRL